MLVSMRVTESIEKFVYVSSFVALGPSGKKVGEETQVTEKIFLGCHSLSLLSSTLVYFTPDFPINHCLLTHSVGIYLPQQRLLPFLEP